MGYLPNSLCLWDLFFSGSCTVLSYGGQLFVRHNDVTSTLLTEVDVEIASALAALSSICWMAGTQLDNIMNGFWGGRSERCFLDVRVFNLLPLLIPHSCLGHYFIATGNRI